MRATTIRRGLVLAVCALGVGSLYLAPTLARSPAQLAQPQRLDEPTGASAAAAPSANRPSVVAQGSAGHSPDPAPHLTPVETPRPPVISPVADSHPPSAGPGSARPPQSHPSGATAFEPGPDHDDQPPAPVPSVQPPQVSRDALDLAWTPATDNVGVVGYTIWLNGFPVATTAQTHATVRWYNDDAVRHAVQIRAIDAMGNQSGTSPTIVVTRPPAVPPPEPTLKPSPEPDPTPQPTAPSEPMGGDPTPSGVAKSSPPNQQQ